MPLFLLVLALWTSSLFADPPAGHFYDPAQIAARFSEQMHPGESLRDSAYLAQLSEAVDNIRCDVTFWAYANNALSRGFHEGDIGESLVRFELLRDRPAGLRHGLFGDDMPDEVYGVARLSTGRGDAHQPHLKPDAEGLTVGLNIRGKWVVLTTTGSKGAFGNTILDFSQLGSDAAAGARSLGFLDSERMRRNLIALQRGQDESSPERYVSPASRWNPWRMAMMAGSGLGEAFFALIRHPLVGLFTLTPAVLTGRRSPFLGYYDIGFGSGHAYLLTEDVPLGEREAFRYGLRLADTEFNRRLRAELPGWIETAYRAIAQGDSSYLTTEFNKWIAQGDVVYDLYVQREDRERPRRTPLERTSRRWRAEKIVVGRLTMLRRPTHAGTESLYADIHRVLRGSSFNPGFTRHFPLGNLGYGRAAGPIVIGDMRSREVDMGTYFASALWRNAIGVQASGIDYARIEDTLRTMETFPARYRGETP